MIGELSSNEINTPGDTMGRQSAGRKTTCGTDVREPSRPGLKIRLADGSEADCRAGIHLAREAHLHTAFRDIPFSEDKARAIFEKTTCQPERFGLIYAVPGVDEPLAEDRLLGFASMQAGEHFLGTGTLIATVQTLNISQNLPARCSAARSPSDPSRRCGNGPRKGAARICWCM
ncbi:hypothetical protein WNZ15_08975 [Roseibium sp. AS2]|uniref:hypothetical protein n=1 Tax=Roseibium sp. AS2 TaxID=3135781 RepID=UPI00316C109B